MIRQVYAQDLYDQAAKEVGKENYVRGYLGYGKNAVLKVSKNLGHNRKDVIKRIKLHFSIFIFYF